MRFSLLVISLLIGLTAQAQTGRPPHKMVITIDDLPYAGVGEALPDAQRVTKKILRTLRAHRVPAIAFVNEAKLLIRGEADARIALLQQWVDAGVTLGNHTYSHGDFNNLTVAQFEDEIIKGEVVTRRLMQSRAPYQLYFRHPQTHSGDTQAKKEASERFLAARGYKVAPHTIENQDYIFNSVYARARRDKDLALAQRVRAGYLAFTIAATQFAERISQQIFGREIPQTLLIHANDLNADCLAAMLRGFEARGYEFVSLDEAMADPAYQTADTYVTKFGPSWLWRWMKSKGMNLDFKDDPEPPQWVRDLYNRH